MFEAGQQPFLEAGVLSSGKGWSLSLHLSPMHNCCSEVHFIVPRWWATGIAEMMSIHMSKSYQWINDLKFIWDHPKNQPQLPPMKRWVGDRWCWDVLRSVMSTNGTSDCVTNSSHQISASTHHWWELPPEGQSTQRRQAEPETPGDQTTVTHLSAAMITPVVISRTISWVSQKRLSSRGGNLLLCEVPLGRSTMW